MNEDEAIVALVDAAPALGLGALVGMALGHDPGLDAVFRSGGQHHAFEVKGSHPLRLRCQMNFDGGFARLPQIAHGLKHRRLNRVLLERNLRPTLVSLAVPYCPHMEEHAEAFLGAFRALGYGLFYVTPGHVWPVVQPHPIPRG